MKPRNKKRLGRSYSAFIKQPLLHLDTLRSYIEEGGDVNKQHKGTNMLCAATRRGCVEAVQYLLDAGVHVNRCDDNGCTPLYLAASHGHETILPMLINSGANPDLRTKNGYTPLVSTIQNNHNRCAHILIREGACVNVSRPNTLGIDISILSYVLFAKGDWNMAGLLLDAGHLPHQFMPPLGFILLEDPNTPIPFVEKLMMAGFKMYCEGWVEMMERRGPNEMTENQLHLLDMLQKERQGVPSLQRLCRVLVRRELAFSAAAGHIRSKIDKLPIPVGVQKYMTLEYL